MSTRLSAAAFTAVVICLVLTAAPASATAVRTFVSGKGSDAGSCSIAAPCRTFAFALTATSDGGEIVVLDSAGYGAVTITKPITISNQTGVEGGITVNSGNAVTINLSSSGTVTLKGLTIDGVGGGLFGIVVMSTAAGRLKIVDCTVRNFTANDLRVAFAGTGGAVLAVEVTDSTFTGSVNGVVLIPGADSVVQAVISRSAAHQNSSDGILLQPNAGASVQALISDVDASENGTFGINVAGNGSLYWATIRNTTAMFNGSKDLNIANTGGLGTEIVDHCRFGFVAVAAGAQTAADGTNSIFSVGGAGTLGTETLH